MDTSDDDASGRREPEVPRAERRVSQLQRHQRRARQAAPAENSDPSWDDLESETRLDPAMSDERAPADTVPATRERHRRDASVLCVAVLLHRTLRLVRSRLRDAQVILLTVPSEPWTTLILKALEAQLAAVLPWRHVIDSGANSSRWVLISGLEDEAPIETAEERLAQAVTDGHSVLGVSANPAQLLPQAFVGGADLSVTLTPLDVGVLRMVARLLTGRSPAQASTPAPDLVRRLTPRLLQIACRRGQTPEAWLRRLVALVTVPAVPAYGISLDDLAGMDAVVEWGRALARDLADYRAGRLGWDAMDRGLLLTGPPGVGKTTAVKAIATSCGVPLVSTSAAVWQRSGRGHLRDVLCAIRTVFDEARACAPAILFIDEMEAVQSRALRNHNADWWTAIINALLEHLDGFYPREGVVVIGASNHPDLIDPALLRAGRLDREVFIGLPDVAGLIGILRYHLREDLAGADLLLVAELLAARAATGADAAQLVREARQRARHAGRELQVDDLVTVAEARGEAPSPELRWRIAVHEAGHVLVGLVQTPGRRLLTASVRAQGGHGGWTVWQREPALAATSDQVAANLRELLGGRAAEQVVLGAPSGGAGGAPESDLARATTLARAAVGAYGLGQGERALLWHGPPQAENLWPRPLPTEQEVEVLAMLSAAYGDCVSMVRAQRGVVEALATRLLRDGEIDGATADALVRE